MNRWSLSNTVFGISHSQFVSLVTEFKKAAEAAFGAKCTVGISVLNAPKVYTTYVDEELERGHQAINNRNTILQTAKFDEVTASLWKQAGYIEVTLRPEDKTKAPNNAFAHAEFKGDRPRQATFYIQPNGESTYHALTAQHSFMWAGDGFESNGRRDGSLPASLFGFG